MPFMSAVNTGYADDKLKVYSLTKYIDYQIGFERCLSSIRARWLTPRPLYFKQHLSTSVVILQHPQKQELYFLKMV